MTEYTDCCECLWDDLSEFPGVPGTPQPSESGGGSLLALGLIAGVIMLSTGRR